MKAKLFKTGNEFLLQSEDGKTLGITSGTIDGRKLSIKNCEAIEFGYDLDKLAENTYREYPTDLKDAEYHYNRDYQVHKKRKAFIKGFQKAIEILGDKKFVLSEEDLHKVLDMARLQGEESFLVKHSNEEIIQSLQQTEWDCIVTKEYLSNNGEWKEVLLPSEWETDTQVRYKTDTDSCLILKRK